MKNITEENIIKQVKLFTQIHPDFGFTITERNIERFAEDLVKKLTIPVFVGQSELLLCKHCDNKKALHSEATGLCPDRFKHFEAK